MKKYDSQIAVERVLPLGLPKFSDFLPHFVKFVGYEMIMSATEPEAEKQPAEKEAPEESKAEEQLSTDQVAEGEETPPEQDQTKEVHEQKEPSAST